MREVNVDLKKITATLIVILLLLCMATASASSSGTVSNPLISLSYLDGAFVKSLKSDISLVLDDAMAGALNKLDEISRNYARYSFAPGFTRISFSAGDTVMISMGSSFILLSGSATLTSVYGAVVNLSTGYEVAAGTRLTQFHRYFCTENTTAVITADVESSGQVDGYYLTDTAVANRHHPVFRDVMENDWYYPAVDFVYGNNLFGGTSANTFSPAMPMTRGMFVTVLYRLEGEPETGSGGQFGDVQEPSLYYYDAVTWANANNIVLGYNSNAFGPNDSVTREQMAAIIYRYAEYKHRDMSESGSVTDSVYDTLPDIENVSDYAVSAARWAVSWGVINGSNGMLLPRNTATRAEVAQIISNYVRVFE